MKNLGIKLSILFIGILTIIAIINFFITPNTLDIFNESILINYSSGFIRRGLLGEVIKQLHLILGFDILEFIKYFSFICYIGFCSYLFYLFRKNKLSIFFLLMPYVLPYYALIHYIRIRDFFLLIIFSICIHYIKEKNNKILLFFLLNLLSIIGTLTHEIYFFFSIPVFIVLLLIKQFWGENISILKHLAKNIIFFIPSIIASFLTIYFHGDSQSVNIIFQDVLSISPEYIDTNMKVGGGIGSLSGQAGNLIPYMYRDLMWNGFSRGISYTLFLFIILYIFLNFDKITFSFTNKKKNILNSDFLTFIFLIQFLSFIPIFIVAIDWQRWFSIIILSSLIIAVQFKNYTINNISPFYMPIIQKIRGGYNKFINNNENIIYLISIFCIIPYYPLGNTPYQFSNLFIIFHTIISKTIHHIFNLL